MAFVAGVEKGTGGSNLGGTGHLATTKKSTRHQVMTLQSNSNKLGEEGNILGK